MYWVARFLSLNHSIQEAFLLFRTKLLWYASEMQVICWLLCLSKECFLANYNTLAFLGRIVRDRVRGRTDWRGGVRAETGQKARHERQALLLSHSRGRAHHRRGTEGQPGEVHEPLVPAQLRHPEVEGCWRLAHRAVRHQVCTEYEVVLRAWHEANVVVVQNVLFCKVLLCKL